MYEIYRGHFYSRNNNKWEAVISCDQEAVPQEVGALDFPGEEPLVIEWEENKKEDVICSSSATLILISPGDRTYENLYTIKPGAIRLDIYKNGTKYWSGVLDPEFYEEPYNTMQDYEVSLTFSDFGILDRLKFDMKGYRTIREVLWHALSSGNLNIPVVESLISTTLDGETQMTLLDLSVHSDNFYDEEGEAMSYYESIKGILQPLGMKMVQKNGRIWIYDLNGLYEKGGSKTLKWMSDDQVMGTSEVYNNAVIRWSPYVRDGNLTNDECYVKKTDASLTALNTTQGKNLDTSIYYSYHASPDPINWFDTSDSGFTIWTDREGVGTTLLDDRVRFFKIVPQADGDESEGVAMYWPSISGSQSGKDYRIIIKQHGIQPAAGTPNSYVGKSLFRTKGTWLPNVKDWRTLRLRIGLELLMDVRYNPFEEAFNMKHEKQADNEKAWKAWGNFLYIPVSIKYKPSGGGPTYCWTNRNALPLTNLRKPMTTINETMGEWVPYDDSRDDEPETFGYLCFYDVTDREEASAIGGWKRNRPAIDPHNERLSTGLARSDNGQYIPYPNYGGQGGEVSLEIRRNGWIVCDGGTKLNRMVNADDRKLMGKCHWILVKIPQIEIQRNLIEAPELETEDVIYKAEINSNAKETLELETVCGTSTTEIPLARGAYFNTGSNEPITSLYRGGRHTQAEELFIGTLYSQYGERHLTLSGTTKILTDNITTYEDVMKKGIRMMVTSEVQDLYNETSETTFVELRPDEYSKTN